MTVLSLLLVYVEMVMDILLAELMMQLSISSPKAEKGKFMDSVKSVMVRLEKGSEVNTKLLRF